ncbi:ABC-type sugar transport system, ATPase component [Thermogladius calderae 1633]|uniref:ABC-type sugar transport system, ATPase component n=1 Tax=Thermogladius calderae (strain DSM 22663 / VKM B-2946 / 1633) TaxID=1184251 RepID=I3TF89_THEC1|nr:sugar ABC transporter ATP-binding protein [Thermogladius calderae]AFK51427.1 ABC-type sugar transport system, ATPase component [Thermogladius calderae 1633]
MSTPPAVKAVNLTKTFPGVVALNNIDFDVMYGEVHAVVGQNGAGKSTLVKVLNGIHPPDRGEIYVDGRQVRIRSPADAKKHGITLVHQELMVYPNLTVAENIFVSRMSRGRTSSFVISRRELDDYAVKYLKMVGLDVDPSTKLRDLGVGEQQLVQIARSLAEDAKVICLDEPTSALTPGEVERLFSVIRELKSRGRAVVYITHYIDEVFKIADRVTVLRDGVKIATKRVAETNASEVVSLMLGRSLSEFYAYKPVSETTGHPLLVVKNLSTQPTRPSEVPLKNISFELMRGEVLGVLGLLGSGKTELAKSLIGMQRVVSGEIWVEGRRVEVKSPLDAARLGIFYLPENRRLEGIVPLMSVKDNILLPSIDLVDKFVRKNSLEETIASDWVRRLNIKTPSLYTKVSNLSGGNQQKVVIAKALARRSRILIFDEPTMGIDIGAKVEIRRIIARLSEEGHSIILATSDVDEALTLSDKILVLYKGEVKGYLRRGEVSRDKVVKLMSGYGG